MVVPRQRPRGAENGDVVRRHAFRYRYDTAAELKLINALYALVRVRLNLLILTGAKAAKLAELMEITASPRSRLS
ncbi:hypothetical protein [Pseudarthrobacter sp. SSS035]|uniref:hypothetical protein n=1 Tax=Pseudarthrobacter sp. SSS035 TaxID=2931399 RepID=UPI00200EB559|nr:hypothetical protein [Pseudarthrobacter sp. SSS035]